MIQATAIVCVKNEGKNLPNSLPPLIKKFAEVIVVDSHSTDGTGKIATDLGVKVHQFSWNNQYPKKRQWVLDNLDLKHNWVFMCDADEIITDNFTRELSTIDWDADGYFVKSDMVWNGKRLKFGMKNNKLCLFKKSAFEYPVVDDLNIDGMGEIEGHYQPIATQDSVIIKDIKSPIIHDDKKGDWFNRHDQYTKWEIEMNAREVWPIDPIHHRELIKDAIRTSPLRPYIVFIYSYILKAGFMDGMAGFNYAMARSRYTYNIVHAIQQTNDGR